MQWMQFYLLDQVVIFIVGYIIFRIIGKKAVQQMTAFDLFFVILIGANLLLGKYNGELWTSVFTSFIFALLYKGFSYLLLHQICRWFLVPAPVVLIRNGRINMKGLKQAKMSIKQLLGKIREKGYSKIPEIELAMMEEDGAISVIPIKKTNSTLKEHVDHHTIPIPVVMDGEILDLNLQYLNRTRDWLNDQLQKYNESLDTVCQIKLAFLNEHGEVEVDTMNKVFLESPNEAVQD
ncbi:DUF421 domain-containing protein [Salirhabdus salicampi]|uniref:DUF421 domain-containing protein n=1 Tax=Salirhabdus salicampi TaxID=476102 RepID=UPI0020C34D35|nr:YetF domain-containing protein [Salirhabdus salicampi]MCP8617974.1 DUF421 domain-containing protein [Salirhabdus salicampi]